VVAGDRIVVAWTGDPAGAARPGLAGAGAARALAVRALVALGG
jgi:membrane carboxypeptidase/penicillin-binding protein PbpC